MLWERVGKKRQTWSESPTKDTWAEKGEFTVANPNSLQMKPACKVKGPLHRPEASLLASAMFDYEQRSK